MFDRPDDPTYLQQRLETFIEEWHEHRRPWYGIDAEKIRRVRLPQPLKWLYGFAGEWPGKGWWDILLGNQDLLLSFEHLSIRDDKLVFVAENQGVWEVATEPEGDDPPVWVSDEGGPWVKLDDSLSRFLVTFTLHETAFGCEHRACSEGILNTLQEAGMHVAPLWLDKPYPLRPLSFHVASGTYLVLDDFWCATNEPDPWKRLPSLFKPPESGNPPRIDRYAPIPGHIRVPAVFRRQHLEILIRKHEEAVEHHRSRCDLYRSLLSDIEDDPD
jgi:hypothetical protein